MLVVRRRAGLGRALEHHVRLLPRAGARQRDGDERGLALPRGQGEEARAKGRAQLPGCVGREGAEGVRGAGFLRDEGYRLGGGKVKGVWLVRVGVCEMGG